MNEREKKLAYILAAVMIFGVGGGGFWYGFYGPYSEIQNGISTLESEIDRQEKELEALQNKSDASLASHARLKNWRTLSFPPPANDQTDLTKGHIASLKLDYQNLLTNLLTRNGFKPTTTTVKSFEGTEMRSIPFVEGTKKPVYTPYRFDVVAEAKLEDLAGFLQQLHQVPLLHHVTYLKIDKGKNTSKGDLKILMHIEALMVADADKKNKLEVDKLLASLKKPPEKEQVLASAKRDYSVLGSANPFFPPDPPPTIVRSTQVAPETIKVQGPREEPEEVLSAVKLTTITGDGKKWEAYLYDQNRGGRETKIRPSAAWSDFSIKDKYENEVLKGKLLHIDPAFILFQYGDEVYMMRCGETLFPCIANPLGKEGLISRGLEKFIPVKPKTMAKPTKESEKSQSKKSAEDKSD